MWGECARSTCIIIIIISICGGSVRGQPADGHLVQPVAGVRGPLEAGEAIGPGRRPRQPEHGQQGADHEVYLGVSLHGVHVHGSIENIHHKAVETKYFK